MLDEYQADINPTVNNRFDIVAANIQGSSGAQCLVVLVFFSHVRRGNEYCYVMKSELELFWSDKQLMDNRNGGSEEGDGDPDKRIWT